MPPPKTEAERALERARWYLEREPQFQIVYRQCATCGLYNALLGPYCLDCREGRVPLELRTPESQAVLGR